MKTEEIGEKVCELIEEITGFIPNQATPINEIGMDSLDSVELVMAAEELFGFEIPDSDVEDLEDRHKKSTMTVGDLTEYIRQRLPAAK